MAERPDRCDRSGRSTADHNLRNLRNCAFFNESVQAPATPVFWPVLPQLFTDLSTESVDRRTSWSIAWKVRHHWPEWAFREGQQGRMEFYMKSCAHSAWQGASDLRRRARTCCRHGFAVFGPKPHISPYAVVFSRKTHWHPGNRRI